MFAPTAAHLVAGLALAKIPYERFVKWALPYILMTLGVTTVTLFVGASLTCTKEPDGIPVVSSTTKHLDLSFMHCFRPCVLKPSWLGVMQT